MSLPENFQFSQSSLQDYVDCPKRFELRYLQHLRWPAPIAEPQVLHEEHLLRGDRFHRMIHQHGVGISASTIQKGIDQPTLTTWWQSYLESALNLQSNASSRLPAQRHTEIVLSAPLSDYRLLAKFDALALEPGTLAIIIDWKTSVHKPNRTTLRSRMQTRVYQYLLAEAGSDLNGGSAVQPEQIIMVYWFASDPSSPEQFDYDPEAHSKTGDYLHNLVGEIVRRETFDLTTDTRHCRFCAYRSLCERGTTAGNFDQMGQYETEDSDGDIDLDLDHITEVEF